MDRNGWTEAKINKLINDATMSKIYSTCHVKAFEHYRRRFYVITMIITFLSAVSTVLEGTNILLEEQYIQLPISVLVLTSITGALSQWMNSKDPSLQAAEHQDASKGYNKVILNIESELALEEDEREKGVEFLKSISNRIEDISTGGKLIPSFIWNKVQRDIGNGKLDPNSFWTSVEQTESVVDDDQEGVCKMMEKEEEEEEGEGEVLTEPERRQSAITLLNMPQKNVVDWRQRMCNIR